ncbi:hypothetical protein DPMN_014136 [Dreissena polymorpha]|uniref:Reverse transcriptase domain-containing protein n=1 Tax=Dreissena polymorpha TaxID=45954 RepID=A0A9D4NB43_DREPO|nr:hypothetical protein DPMN_014136 [Dreissena polymorpha]
MDTYSILSRYTSVGLFFASLNVLVLMSIHTNEIALESSLRNIKGQSQLCRCIRWPYTRAIVGKRYVSNSLFVIRSIFVLITVVLFTWIYAIMLLSGDIELNPGPVSISSLDSNITEYNSLNCLLAMPNNLSFLQYNVQSIRNKIEILTAELSNFDILSFSETWLNNSIETDELLIPSYQCPERKDRIHDSHGGVMLYVKDCIHYKRRVDLEPITLECIWIELHLLSMKRVLFGIFYRPPNADASYTNLIDDSIGLAIETGISDIIITGDFNMNNSQPILVRKLDSWCLEYNLVQVINEPTHFTERSSSILDLLLLTNPNSLVLSGVGDPFLDQQQRYHCPIYGLFKYKKPNANVYERHIWSYEDGNYDLLRETFSSLNWNTISSLDTDTYCTNITDTIIRNAKLCIPNRVIKIKPRNAPWLNTHIRRMIRKRKRAYRIAKTKKSDYHWSKFRTIRNQTISFIRQAKNQYYDSLSDKLKENNDTPKNWWKILKSFINKPNNNMNSHIINPLDNSTVTDCFEKANILNTFFQSQSIINIDNVGTPELTYAPNTNSLETFIISPSDVHDILKSLSVDKASGPDGISNHILKECRAELSTPLCDFFNFSLNKCIMPSCWKEANVTAVLKKGDPKEVSNYRPISLLNTMEKVFEKIIFKHVYNHLVSNKILTPFQSGFLPGDSTTNQLTYIYDTFCKALDNGLEVKAVFFDISKAFDKVWHQGLLLKLHAYGIRGKLLSWIQNYLNGRRQRVVIPGAVSNWALLEAGVPQGSILGPLLFLIFINDIVNDIQSSIRLFADDTSLYIIIDEPNHSNAILQNDINKISNWALKWHVLFNPSKSESLTFSRKQQPNQYNFTMLATQIPGVSSHKHLGVFLSKDCKWHIHLKYITDKAWGRINIMRKLKFKLDRKSLEIIYTSFIRPLIEYSDVIWDNCTQEEKYELDKIQNEAARIACGATKLVSLNDLQHEINWEPLQDRRDKHKLILFYKMQNSLSPQYLSDLVPQQVGSIARYNLRNANDLRTTECRSTLYYNSFVPAVIRKWNTLPDEVKNSESLNIFKSKLNRTLVKTPAYYYVGKRYLQLTHTRLRTKSSALNDHLFAKNIISSPLCSCGAIETTNHFFFLCPKYNHIRTELINIITGITSDVELDTLLFGCSHLDEKENSKIFKCVQQYIKESRRFS